MKTLSLIIAIFTFSAQISANCIDSNLNNSFGSANLSALYMDHEENVGASAQNLSSIEKSLLPYLDRFFGNERGERAVQLVVSEFDKNKDKQLTADELEKRFSQAPFEFSWGNRIIGSKKLVSDFGTNKKIDRNGVRKFIQHYGYY